MSTLHIDYGKESAFKKSINDAKSEINKRIDDYENIARRVERIPGTNGNTSNCAYYARKKKQSLEGKINKLNSLERQADAFVDNVKETDKGVANRIKKGTGSFKKRTGIGKKSKSVIASVCGWIGDRWDDIKEGVSKIWEGIKDFYEKNKYWINIVVDVVIVVVAVAACIGTGGLALAVGVFFAVDAVCDLFYDGAAAYAYYAEGDEAKAERLAEKGGKDAFMFVGRKIDELAGTEFFEGAMGILYTGLTICAVVYSFYKAGKQILKDLKLDKIKVKSILKGDKHIKWKSHFNKQNITKAAKNFFGFKKVKQSEVMKLRYKKILGIKIGELLIKTPERAKKLLYYKKSFDAGKKIVKDVWKYYTDTKEGDYNPFKKTKKAIEDFINSCKAAASGGYA